MATPAVGELLHGSHTVPLLKLNQLSKEDVGLQLGGVVTIVWVLAIASSGTRECVLMS